MVKPLGMNSILGFLEERNHYHSVFANREVYWFRSHVRNVRRNVRLTMIYHDCFLFVHYTCFLLTCIVLRLRAALYVYVLEI